MTENDYYSLFLKKQEDLKHQINLDFEKEKQCFTSLYNTTYKTFLVLYNNFSQLSETTLYKNVKLGLFYRLLSLYTSTLKLLEYGYLNDVKALLRILLETTELQTHFKHFENDIPKWLDNEYEMDYIIEKLKTIQKLPPIYSEIYGLYSGKGAHLFPPNLLSFFDCLGENIKQDLNKSGLILETFGENKQIIDKITSIEEFFEELLKRAPAPATVLPTIRVNIARYDPEICNALYTNLLVFMCLNLITAKDYLERENNEALYLQIEKDLTQAYKTLNFD
jgi:hypothetical protein